MDEVCYPAFVIGLTRRVAAVLLLIAWVPATAHCYLERVLDSPLLHCVPEAAADHHDAGDCDADACAAVESGQIALSQWRTFIVPVEGIGGLPSFVGECVVAAPYQPVGLRPAPPPDSINRWHFLLRVAPPARAPDLLSA